MFPLLIALLSLGLALAGYEPWWAALLYVAAARAVPSRRMELLAAVSWPYFLLMLFPESLALRAAFRSLEPSWEPIPWGFRLSALAAYLGFAALVLRRVKRWPVLFVLSLHLASGFAVGYRIVESPEWVGGFLLAWYFVSAKFFWFLTMALAERRLDPKIETSTHLLAFRPFWGADIPIPHGGGALAQSAEETPRRGFMKLFLVSLLYFAASYLIGNVFLAEYGGRDPSSSLPFAPLPVVYGDLFAAAEREGWGLVAAAVIVRVTAFFLHFAAIHGFAVACARAAGFSLPRYVYKPFAADSFREFYFRLQFYYGRVIVLGFLQPLFTLLRIPNFTARSAAAAFLGVLGAGLIQQVVSQWHLVLSDAPPRALATVLFAFLPHYTFVALSVALSTALDGKLRLPPGLRIALYLVLYAGITFDMFNIYYANRSFVRPSFLGAYVFF